MQLYVIARHGESTLNLEQRVNGDPTVQVYLTEKGRGEAQLLGQQTAHIPIDLCLHTPFSRTRETAEIALAGRDVPFEEVPELGDVDIGELEGGRWWGGGEASAPGCCRLPGGGGWGPPAPPVRRRVRAAARASRAEDP